MKLAILYVISLLLPSIISYGQEKPPNVIVIMADDLGYGGIGCYGNTLIETPHLDSLARHGIRFTDFHANAPVCTPTRASLLTGNYPQRSGLEGVIYVQGETRQVGLDTTALTVAELLRQRGYATGIMGKWHLGYQEAYNPVVHGFDTFHGYVSGNIDYHSHYDNAGIYDWWHNLDSVQEEGYVTDLITRHSVDFIREHQQEPFFLYVAHEAPHVPFQGRDDPAYRFPGKEFTYYGPVEDRKATYREMVEVMDEGVGEIMRALRENKLEENTLVLFLSDNGALEAYGNNGELNGEKGKLLEGGHRVPAIAYWKGTLTPGVSSATWMSMDLLPTLLSLTRTDAPKGITFDGINVSSALLEGKALPERSLFWRYNNQKAVREGPWKMLITKTDTALYNLEQDMQESNNLYASQRNKAADLQMRLARWEEKVMQGIVMKTR